MNTPLSAHWNSLSSWLVLAIGLTIVAMATTQIKTRVDRDEQQKFDLQCNDIKDRITERLYNHARILRCGAALFEASEHITREEWHRYTELQNIEQQLPGLQGIGFSLLIQPEDLDRHIQKIRKEGFPEYTVKPLGVREVYSAIIYLEPFTEWNQRAMGYDTFSEPVRRAAMERARDENVAVLSAKVRLVQEGETDIQPGALIYVPVYHKGMPTISVEQRRTALFGWVAGVYRMNDLVRGILGPQVLEEASGLFFEIFDGESSGPQNLLYQSHPIASGTHASKKRFDTLIPIEFNGHRWTLHGVHSNGGLFAVHYMAAWFSLLGGSLIVFLLFGLMRSLLNTRDKAHQIAQELTINLRDERQRMASIIQGTNVGTWEWNIQTGEVVFNEKWAQIIGYTLEELAPITVKTWKTLTHPDDLKRSAELMDKHFSGALSFYNCECRMKHKDGRWIWIQDRGQLLTRTRDGQPLMMFGTHTEVNDRKQTEKHISRLLEESNQAKRALLGIIEDNKRSRIALLESEAALVEAQSIACMGSYVLDIPSGRWTRSATLEKILGIDKSYGRTVDSWKSLVHPDDRALLNNYLQGEVIGNRKEFNKEFRIIRPKDKAERWIHGLGRLELDGTDSPVKLVGTSQDITERRQAEDALRTSEEKFSKAFNLSPNMLCITRAMDGSFIDYNHAFLAGFEYSKEDMVKNTTIDLEMWGKIEDRNRIISDLGKGIQVLNREYLFRNKSRKIIPCLFSAKIIQINNMDCVISSINDISKRKQAEEKVLHLLTEATESRRTLLSVLEDQKQTENKIHKLNAELEQRVIARTAELETANKELEAFSYSVSHDLRAPLRAVDGYTRMLTEDYGTVLDDEGLRICSVISNGARDMGRLIDDLLAFSRFGRATISPSVIDMTSMARAIFFEQSTPEERDRVEFILQSLPDTVGDTSLIRQVWVNLLSNALKFSLKKERAVIEVSASQQDDEIIYCVRDNGAGFDMRYANKLFGVFQRLHSTKEFAGTGVGLAIVQRIIVRHGGRIWAEAQVDKGATFYFALKGVTEHG